MAIENINTLGVVVIGRNEGERLRRCLESAIKSVKYIVYVDSGSTDNSVVMARNMGVEVVTLDLNIPFTAARARNAGFDRLLTLSEDIKYVQFVDGDCEIVDGWMSSAFLFLESLPNAAVATGRRRERFPENSIYNLLCDIEWNSPIGKALACGGDAMMRVSTFKQVSGYRPDLIAGEEPELCVRLRQAGYEIWRLDHEMTLHDAAITQFNQWWRRTLRSGYAFAEGARLHGAPPERHWVKESRSAWIWGLGLPLVSLTLIAVGGVWGLATLLIYPLQVLRLSRKGNLTSHQNFLRAFFLVLGKFPEAIGQLKYEYHRFIGKKSALIEYK